jgi:tetratricopeptide (TPR) repeat protein
MTRILLCFLLLGLPAARAADLGKFTLPDDNLPWTRDAALDAQFGGQVVRASDPRGTEMLVILPETGIEAAPDAVMASILGEVQRVDASATLAGALQLGFGENTWFGLGQHQGGFVLYRGAVNKGRIVYPIALRVPAPGILSEEHRQFLRELTIQRVVTRTPAAALLTQANRRLIQKDLPGALALFNQAVAKDPASPEVYYFRGLCQKRMKNYPAARADLDQAIARKRSADFLVERGDVETDSGNAPAAFAWLERALAEEPENDAVHRYLGKAHYYAGQTAKSAAAYSKALELNPANRGARATLIKLHARTHDAPAAAAQLQAFRQLHPGDPYADELKQEILKENPKAGFAAGPAPAPSIRPEARSAPPPPFASTAPQKQAAPPTPALRTSAAPVVAVSAAHTSPPPPSAAPAPNDNDQAAQEAFKQLPPLPPLATMLAQASATPVAPKLDLREFSSLQYLGAVAAVRQAMEQLAGPMTAEARRTFEARWAAIEDYPAAACIEYLNAAAPLLGEILSLRASMTKVMQGYDNLLNQAQLARFCGNHAAAHETMRRAGQHAALLKALQRRAEQAVQSLAALGELPDAALIKARVAEQFASAKSLLRNLDKPPALSGEFEPAPYVSIQDPFDSGRSRDRNDAIVRTEPDNDYERPTYFQPLKSLGANLLLLYFCETAPTGELSSGMELFEDRGDGSFVGYRGGSELTKTVFTLSEAGLQKTEYSLGPRRLSSENNNFADEAAALVAKGREPTMELTRSIRSRAYYPTHVQYQKPPTGDGFDWSTWESLVRKGEKEIVAEFEGYRRAFEALAPKVGFPQPIPAEHIFWVLDRTEIVNEHPSAAHRVVLQVENPRANDAYRQAMRRTQTDDPRPTLSSERRTEVTAGSLSHQDTRSVYDDSTTALPVHDSMELGYSITWSPPAPVVAQSGGAFTTELTAQRSTSAPKVGSLVPSPFPEVTATVSLAVVTQSGTYSGQGGDGTKAGLLSRHLRTGPGKVSQPSTLTCPLHALYGERATVSMLFAASEVTSLSGAGVRYHYKRRIMTPEEAASLASTMGDARDLAAHQAKTAAARAPKAAAAPIKADQQAAQQVQAETIAFHESTILYEKKRAQQYQQDIDTLTAQIGGSGQAPTTDQQKRIAALRFNLVNAQSNALSEQDTIRQLQTGTYQRTETPFDVMARSQFRRNIEDNIRRIEAVETQQELAEKYIELLPAAERPQAIATLQKVRDEAPDSLGRYQKLTTALKSKWQGHTEAKLAKLDEDLAWKDAQVQALENIKSGSDTGLMVCSMMGGPQAVALTYQFASGWAEKDLLTGVKQSVSMYSDAVDAAWSSYDGYCQGGWAGAAKAGGASVLMNKGLPFLLAKVNKGGDLPDATTLKAADSSAGAAKQAGAPAALPRGNAGKAAPSDAARYEAELRAADEQVQGFVGDFHAWKQAVHDGVPEAEAKRLHQKVLDATVAINGNPTAKGVLKYKAQPAVGRFYEQTLDQIHTRARADYYATMRQAGYGDHEILAIRNAASSGSTGMDFDQALKEQPDWIPVRNADGTTSLRRNVWLTKNGQPATRHQWQVDAQEAWNKAYRKTTGASAPQAWEKMTSRVDPEAYRMMAVLNIHKDLSNVDEVMDNLDPQWVRQLSDVTLFKAGEMLKDKSLSRLAGVREACRGTAKDLEGKFLPFIDAKLAALKKIPAAKLTASDKHNLTRLESARERFGKVRDSFGAIGRAELPPGQWDDAIALSTGGKGIIETIQDLSDLTNSLFK